MELYRASLAGGKGGVGVEVGVGGCVGGRVGEGVEEVAGASK